MNVQLIFRENDSSAMDVQVWFKSLLIDYLCASLKKKGSSDNDGHMQSSVGNMCTKVFFWIVIITLDIRGLGVDIGSEWKLGEPCSNTNRVRYIHFHRNTLEKDINLSLLPHHYGLNKKVDSALQPWIEATLKNKRKIRKRQLCILNREKYILCN